MSLAFFFFFSVLTPYLSSEQCCLLVNGEVDDRSLKYDDKVRLIFSVFYTQKVHQVLL